MLEKILKITLGDGVCPVLLDKALGVECKKMENPLFLSMFSMKRDTFT